MLAILVTSSLFAQTVFVRPRLADRQRHRRGGRVRGSRRSRRPHRRGDLRADLAASTSANDQHGGQLVQALRGSGIEEKDIQADHADLEIVDQRDGIAQGVAGYRMRRTYSVTLRDVKKLDAVVRLALRSGANHLDGYELRTSQLRKYRDEVRKRAIAAAREEAEALAGEAPAAASGIPSRSTRASMAGSATGAAGIPA